MTLSPTSSRGGSGSAAAVTLLSTNTLAAPGTIDVATIPQTYTDLLLVMIVRGTNAASADSLTIVINNDGGANYTWTSAPVVNVTLAGQTNAGSGVGVIARIPANTATANTFGTVEMVIAGYTSTARLKTVISHFGDAHTQASADSVTGTAEVQWNSTAAINRLTFAGNSAANLATGTVLRIYGRN